MLINLTNHPFALWGETQKKAASVYGEIKDLPFPNISPDLTSNEVLELAEQYYIRCEHLLLYEKQQVILVAGELTFCFFLIQRLLLNGYTCLTSTSERNVIEEGGIKIAHFVFKQFREYKLIK